MPIWARAMLVFSPMEKGEILMPFRSLRKKTCKIAVIFFFFPLNLKMAHLVTLT